MQVILATTAGFCWGVQRAVDRARRLASQSEDAIHTDGPLIHNEQMMDQLQAEGVIETPDPQSLTHGVLMVRAHGIPPERRAMLKQLPVTLVDATCPDVAKIQGLIRKHASDGFHTIIFGDPGHAEVTGLLGYAQDRGFVVSCPADVASLPDVHPICLVSQSTQLPLSYETVAEAVRTRFPNAKVLDTICRSTRNRQQELLAIAKQADALVVVGGAHSANTVRLVKLAESLRPTFHIQTGDQLDMQAFHNFQVVGLTAGASTPAFIIEDVKRRLEAHPHPKDRA